MTQALEDAFPSLIGEGEGQINIQDIIDSRASAGIIALLGLAYAGMGFLDALRDGLRRVFATSDVKLSFVKKKLTDVVVLVLLGLALLGSLVVTSMATAATTFALDQVGLDQTPVAVGLLKVISVAVALAADTVLFAIVFSRLPGANLTWRQVRSGALLAAVGFELLKLARHVPDRSRHPEPALRDVRRRGGSAGVDELRGQAHDLRGRVDGHPALLAGAGRPR